MDNLIGKRLAGRYQIESLVGMGGMANVYRGTDTRTGNAIAVKVLKEEFLDNEELVRRLNAGEVPHVRQAFLANAQSKVLLVEFDQEIAEKILDAAPKFCAAPHPVGSESKYEFAPMIYRVSGTFRAQDPTIEHRMIRINPMRSGPDTIIRILRSCMEQVEEN
mgnify:CR=1 FL=1